MSSMRAPPGVTTTPWPERAEYAGAAAASTHVAPPSADDHTSASCALGVKPRSPATIQSLPPNCEHERRAEPPHTPPNTKTRRPGDDSNSAACGRPTPHSSTERDVPIRIHSSLSRETRARVRRRHATPGAARRERPRFDSSCATSRVPRAARRDTARDRTSTRRGPERADQPGASARSAQLAPPSAEAHTSPRNERVPDASL